MGFNTLAESEYIATLKDTEFAKVSVVHITPDAKFPNAKERVQIEVRLYFEGNRGMTPTKTALVFDSPEDITELVEALSGVAAVFAEPSIQALIPKPAPVVPVAAAAAVRKLGNGVKPVAKKRPVRKVGA